MADDKKSIPLKLLVDKEKNRVVFVESDKDVVDVLFSFLTLPIGTIVRLLNKKSSLGCIDRLYESVENLDDHYFRTEACKNMLLSPRAAAEVDCEELKMNVDDLCPRRAYRCSNYGCSNFECFSKTDRLYSPVPKARCPCGKSMEHDLIWTKKRKADEDGVFIKVVNRFLITDDMEVYLVSTATSLSLLDKLGIKDGSILEERNVECGRDEVLSLLQTCISSTTPLSEVFLGKQPVAVDKSVKSVAVDAAEVKVEVDSETVSSKMKVKIIKNKVTNKTVYAEAGEDFIDLLFSFLTLPLGSIMKLLVNKSIRLGCIHNLYKSIEILGNCNACIKSEDCKMMLLSPKLAAHFNISNQILKIDAMPAKNVFAVPCTMCFWDGSNCSHGAKNIQTHAINPKSPTPGVEVGGGFVKVSGRFMVTNDLVVTPLSAISGINLVNRLKIPITNLEERVIDLGESEALDVLKACIISSKPLRVFSLSGGGA